MLASLSAAVSTLPWELIGRLALAVLETLF